MLIQYIRHEKHVIEEDYVVNAIRKCDICGKEITNPYFEIVSSHYEWMNDSLESFKTIDCCCGSCLRRAIDMYIVAVDTCPSIEFDISYELEAVSSQDLSKIDEDAEQRMEDISMNTKV